MLNPDQNDKLYVCARTQKQSSHTSFVCVHAPRNDHTHFVVALAQLVHLDANWGHPLPQQ
jgi:hypothetical protein